MWRGKSGFSTTDSCGNEGVTAEQYCMNVVKEFDYDNYLCGLLHPKEARRGYFAIRAFNCEVAKIKDQVHGNAMTGAIRFQWWHDQIESVYHGKGASSEHPLVRELSHVVEAHGLTKRLFARCIEARQGDLTLQRVETLDDLEDYAEGAHSSILYLLLQVLGVQSRTADYVASHVGVCSGLATLLRGTAFHASKGAIYIPREIAGRVNLVDHVLIKGPQTESEAKALQEAVFDVAAQAHGHLDKARLLLSGQETVSDTSDGTGEAEPVPSAAIYALMPAVRASMLLEDLRSTNFNPFDAKIIGDRPALMYQIKLLKTITFKTF